MTISDAKERVSIPYLWSLYGYEGNPLKSCKSPFRDESNSSFSVFAGGTAWKDHGTGEGGDSVTFIQMAEGLSNADACRKIISYAGGGLPAFRPPAKVSKPKSRKPKPPTFSQSESQKEQLAELRNVSPEAIEICLERGLLKFGNWKRYPSWFITDKTGQNIQVRRLDGEPWPQINAKAWTLPSSHASWPIGLEESLHYPIVLLVEGGPDLLAAAHFAWCEGRDKETAIVAMLGASQKMKSVALAALAGKRIRIFSHNDRSGIAATKRWAKQLKNVGSVVDAVSFDGLVQTDGAEVCDLNDLCNVHADVFEQHEEIQNLVP